MVESVADQMIPVLNMSSSLPWAPESIRIKQVEEQVSALRTSVICAFNQLLDLKDLNTGVHSTRLAEWGMRVGQELGLDESELQNLEVVALLHDIGKVGVPDSILKKPGKLDDEEYALMKKHPEYGWAVLRMLPGFERAALEILHHHESFDGKGYPAGLKETEIPIVSRIVTVIDAFDAMVSSRPYRKGLPHAASFNAAAHNSIPSLCSASCLSRKQKWTPSSPRQARPSPRLSKRFPFGLLMAAIPR